MEIKKNPFFISFRASGGDLVKMHIHTPGIVMSSLDEERSKSKIILLGLMIL